MRGKIDLSGHKFAKLFRPPAQRSNWRRFKSPKMPDQTYRQLVRLIDGAVRDTFANHPEYLTKAGQQNARASLVKRVAGALWGYAQEVSTSFAEAGYAGHSARGRSVDVVDAPTLAAADTSERVFTARPFNAQGLIAALRVWFGAVRRPINRRVVYGDPPDTIQPNDRRKTDG